MKKNNEFPFKTPEGYFDSFQNELMAKLSEENVEIPRDRAFEVPDNYFETFNHKLKSKLDKEPKVIQFSPFKKLIAVAASVAAVAIIFLRFNWSSAEELSFSDLANTDIEAYFENNDFGLSSYEIAEVIPVTDTEFYAFLNSPIDDDNIVDYLSENINDFENFNTNDNE